MVAFVDAVCFVYLLHIFGLVLFMLSLHDEAVPEEPRHEEYEEEAKEVSQENDEQRRPRYFTRALT